MKTDRQLQEDVLDELQWEPRIDANEIGVGAHNGIVTLSDFAPSYVEKTGRRARCGACQWFRPCSILPSEKTPI